MDIDRGKDEWADRVVHVIILQTEVDPKSRTVFLMS
jgi:hypothetical protein